MSERRTTRDWGDEGEDIARDYLDALGWTVEAANVWYRAGELDLVAWDPGERQLVFVEVRSSWSRSVVEAAQTVTFPKQRKLEKAALLYLATRSGPAVSARFDVVGVHRSCRAVVRHVRGAFEATGGG